MVKNSHGLLALSPIVLFLGLYLIVSIVIGDFYKMPISVALIAASVWAVATMRGVKLSERIEIFSNEAGQPNIIYMIWVFILAGAFSAIAQGIGAVDATVNLTVRYLPSEFLIPGIYLAACFISLSIGTSVGTVVALTPLVTDLSEATGVSLPLFIAVVLGGAFFGDNLSFISDTTIAATRTQGIKLNEKFKANIAIVLPAAIITLALYIFLGAEVKEVSVTEGVNYWLIIPYLLVFVNALIGINVTVVLVLGIAGAILIGALNGFDLLSLAGFIGNGVESMGSLIVITLLAAGMLGVIKASGGIEYLLQVMTKRIHGSRGAQAVIALITGLVNMCTANNTVAIITVGTISHDIAQRFRITGRKVASILDTSSCIVQCLIPYGAQTLFATSLAEISPVAPWPYLYYPWVLTVALIISIIVRRKNNGLIQPQII
jgi:Na+/H+ antiporter NhaC